MKGLIKRILLISAEKGLDSKLVGLLSNHGEGFEVDQVFPLEKAIGGIDSGEYDLIILDFPAEEDCSSAAEKLCGIVDHLPIVVFSHFGNKYAIQALKKGAQQIINKSNLDSQLLVHTVMAAMDKKRIENEIHIRDEILQAVNNAAEIFLSQSNWDIYLDDVLESLGKATRSDRVYVFKNAKDENGDIIAYFIASWRADGDRTAKTNLFRNGVVYKDVGHQRWIKLMGNGEIVHGDVEDLPAEEQPFLMKLGTKSFIDVPIFIKNKWWGFIGFDHCNRRNNWTQVEIDALKTAANILGAAISRQAAEEKLTYLATHDYLTDLPNRLLFEDRFHQAVARAERSGAKFAIISIDIDEFKVVNDTFGHPVGDKVLVEIARRLERAIRGSDTCARIGGDEFGVIAEEIHNKSDVLRVMQKITDALQSEIKVCRKKVQSSASMGASIYPSHGVLMEDLFRVADKALYMVKGTSQRFRVFSDEQISWIKD